MTMRLRPLNARRQVTHALCAYLCGEYSIANIANWSWVSIHFWAGVDIDDLPNLKAWIERIRARSAVQRGITIPEPIQLDNGGKEPKEMAQSILVTGREQGQRSGHRRKIVHEPGMAATLVGKRFALDRKRRVGQRNPGAVR